MPLAFIPAHMAHLKISGGLPVPVVVAESRVGRIELHDSAWPIADLMTVFVPEGSGPPDFGKYDEEKARRCMTGRYCHVCGAKSPDLLICSPKGPRVIRVSDTMPVWAVDSPWVCAACLAFACLTCPPLKKAIAEDRGVVFAGRVSSPLVATFWQPVDPGDPVPPLGATVLTAFKIDIGDPGVGAQSLASWRANAVPRFARKWGISSCL